MSKQKGQQQPQAVILQDGVKWHGPQWWGVKDDKGQWAFGGGMVCHYPDETIAKAHAESLSPRWKATPFAS